MIMSKLASAKEQTVGYFKGVYREMQRVVWPSRKKTITDSLTVVAFSILMAAFLAGLDFVFSSGVQKLLEVVNK